MRIARNIALFITAAAAMSCDVSGGAGGSGTSTLRSLAQDYYAWRDSVYPVASSDAGLHTWDDRLTDYTMKAVTARRKNVAAVLAEVSAMPGATWDMNERVDWHLFRAQLEGADFFARVQRREESDPQIYVAEIANGIFSLLKKEYAPPHTRARAAMARLEQVPAMLDVARGNLTSPVKLYAQLAIASARGGDDLYQSSLMTLAGELARDERQRLTNARDGAIKALHDFADWLEDRLAAMPDWTPMGEENYNYLLKNVLLLPLDAKQVEMLGQSELARQGLYSETSAAYGQVLRLSRYRAARIGVDVNLQTGRWTFEEAVTYFMEAGGLDREAAEGEAAGAAVSPSQKIGYLVGKWQINRLLGKYRDKQGDKFRLGAFHDELISYGSLPVSIIEWLMLGDASALEAMFK